MTKFLNGIAAGLLTGVLLVAVAPSARAQESFRLPVLAPVTGFLALEGTSQRNGAVLALRSWAGKTKLSHEVLDTAASPQVAIQAFEKALRHKDVIAVSAPMYGNSMLALLPLAKQRHVPLLTVSGTAKLTELGNPYIFRFFPGDAVVKRAQAHYVAKIRNFKRVALIAQNTAYGQSGRRHLAALFKEFGVKIVYENSLPVTTKEMLPVVANVKRSDADVVVLHLHSGSTALFIRQAASFDLGLPIVAGSAMHQPSTAALLQPRELKDVCAETSASPISGGSPAMEKFAAAYRTAFKTEPDAFAVGQYDAVRMALKLIAQGNKTRDKLSRALAEESYDGIAMTYKSDGTGNMAHSAMIICYDGKTRVPQIVQRYEANATD